MRVTVRIALFLLLQLAALELGARLFVAWDGGARLPLAPTDARHAEIMEELMREGRASLRYLRFDPATGWTTTPGFRPRPDEPWELYSTNSAGCRGTVEADASRSPGTLRVACFGDSYTHGDDVADADTYPARLAALLGATCEVLNFGVPGFGPDQALLRYRAQGRAMKPDLVLFAVTDENASRLLTVFRPFYAFFHFLKDDLVFPKPRFRLAAGELELIPSPVARFEELPRVLDPAFRDTLGAHDEFYRMNPLVRPPLLAHLSTFVHVALAAWIKVARRGQRIDRILESDGIPIFRALLSAFAREAEADGARFGVLLLTEQTELAHVRDRRYRSLVRNALLDHLEAKGIPFLELDGAFKAALRGRRAEELIPGHYSPEGNGLVARAVADWLARTDFLKTKPQD